jgi:hypothetical protein
MARSPRLFAPGLLYHVIARGNQRQPTFLDDADYRRLAYRLTDVAALLGRDPATLGKAITRLAAKAQRDDAVANQLRDFGDCPEVKV